MTVVKTYWKLLKRNLPLVILYTVLLIGFSAANMKTNEKDLDFVASKPSIIVVNQDEQGTLSRHLIDYLKTASHLKVATSTEEEQINDALFYREANYVIYIPDDYSETFMSEGTPELTVKSTGDYQASLAEMILSRYLNTASIYQKNGNRCPPINNLHRRNTCPNSENQYGLFA
ncbi:MAG: ABC transporter permease [Leuconostoc sp.]|nr:ABC transporter permease [Leuconostoc sp.]